MLAEARSARRETLREVILWGQLQRRVNPSAHLMKPQVPASSAAGERPRQISVVADCIS